MASAQKTLHDSVVSAYNTTGKSNLTQEITHLTHKRLTDNERQ